MTINILTIETSSLGDRSYLAHDGQQAVVVDPQRDIDRVLDLATRLGLQVSHVVETHVHNDYVSGGLDLAQRTGAAYLVPSGSDVDFDHLPVGDGDIFTAGQMRLRVLHTPGHTHHHVSYVLETEQGVRAVFTGGSMLYGSTGRTDLVSAAAVSAALSGNLDVAVGNILGGIAIQTVVLVVLDVFGVRGPRPLTHHAASLVLVLNGGLVVAVLGVVIAGTQLPGGLIVGRVAPGRLLIAVLWVVGLFLMNKANKSLPWHESAEAPQNQEHPRGHAQAKTEQDATSKGLRSTRSAVIFSMAALVTLVAGVVLERSGDAIAGDIGLSGVLFGATFLAAATSLPEVSTGLTSVKSGDYQLAVSDIFGGNAFLPVLFLLATILSGKAVLPQAHNTDIYLTALGILLTVVYMTGLIFRPSRRIARMGLDSLVVLILYVLGLAGLFAIAASG